MNKLLLMAAAAAFVPALPGYHFTFPRDHGSHPDYKTEWWYYTGHLNAGKQRTFGFELTFFRFGITREAALPRRSHWRIPDLYLAHFALTDEAGHRFRFADRLNRPGLGLAGARPDRLDVRDGSWLATGLADGHHHLRARDDDAGLDLVLASKKPPVLHGHDGISEKADCPGCASHYYSLTRMAASGVLSLQGERLPVTGQAWMDHEFGSNQLAKGQVGWDWYSLQLDDGAELMLYRLRLADDKTEPASSGTYVRPDGTWVHLPLPAFTTKATGSWDSPRGGHYPQGWQIKVPGEKLDLTVTPTVQDQELAFGGPAGSTYWEGSVRVTGSHTGKTIGGEGYVELTGYAPASRPPI